MGIARDLGYLKIPRGLVVDFKKLQSMPDAKVTLVCTGSQGEPLAALSRMANETHQIRLNEGDTVLLASSLIPGNENAIYGIINKLTDLGVKVVHKGNAKVHVSGHASAGELVYCYNIVKPTHVMPVHGESKHLHANADLAARTGVDPERIIIAADGTTVDLVGGRARISGRVEAGLVYVDGHTVGKVTEETLVERRLLQEGGVVTVVAIVDADTNALAEPLEFIAKGFVHDEHIFDGAAEKVKNALAKPATSKVVDLDKLETIIADTVSRHLERAYRRAPLVTVVVIDA
jgi:ribonuclease J